MLCSTQWMSKFFCTRTKSFRQQRDWVYDHSAKGPTYRDLYPDPPPPFGLIPSCSEGGVLGILPGVVGSIQANEVIKIILGIGQTLSGRILSYNALDMTFREFQTTTQSTYSSGYRTD